MKPLRPTQQQQQRSDVETLLRLVGFKGAPVCGSGLLETRTDPRAAQSRAKLPILSSIWNLDIVFTLTPPTGVFPDACRCHRPKQL